MGLMAAALITSVASGIASGVNASRTASAVTAEGARLAADARTRGLDTERDYRLNLGQHLATQRNRIAAAGVDLTQGSAAQLRANDQKIGEMDVATIRANVAREARGITANAATQSRGLRVQAMTSFATAGANLLLGSADAWGSYQANRSANTFSTGYKSSVRSLKAAP